MSVVFKQLSNFKLIYCMNDLNGLCCFCADHKSKMASTKRHTLFSEIKKNQVIEEKLYIDDH